MPRRPATGLHAADDRRDFVQPQQEVVVAAIQPAAFDEPLGQSQVVAAHVAHNPGEVRSDLLPPPVLFLETPNQRARERQDRPPLPPREVRLKGAPCRIRVGGLPIRNGFRVLGPRVQLLANRKQHGGGVLVHPRQRPVGFVTAAMTVLVEKPIELLEEAGAGKRAAEVGERAVVLEQIRHRRGVVTGRGRKRHEVERLLGADRSSAGCQLRIYQPVGTKIPHGCRYF